MSHRDYWFVTLDDGMVLIISRDSKSRRVLVSAVTNDQPLGSPPQDADFDPDQLVEGSVLASANNTQRTIVKITSAPQLAVTRRET